MAFSQKLVMRQGQSLVMTPQLSQSIKLLTLSNIELAAFVEGEMERNPFLDGDAGTDTPTEHRDSNSKHETTENVNPDQAIDITQHQELETSAQSMADNLGTSVENEFPDEQDYRSKSPEPPSSANSENDRIGSGGIQLSSSSSAHDQSVADYTAKQENLSDHLAAQLALSAAPTIINLIVADMIDNLDDAGYLRTNLEDISDRLGCDWEQLNQALKLLQSFEPTGIGAQNLSECLELQLREANRFDPAMACIINNLDLLANRDFANLQKLSGLEVEELHDALLEIQSLDPKPGTLFESGPVQHIVPDIHVREASDGSWMIELNSETLPRVLINNTYATRVKGQLSEPSEREFLTDCLQSANWLTKSLDQRAQTILKVAKEIVKQQDAFLAYGVRHLRPLTLRAVADEIEMHESSVSRVTTNKYMMTPRGIFELKYFFTTGISSSNDGESHSSESVKDQIQSMIRAETAGTILSDDAIVSVLKASGVEIARRTIAKYREAMNIPSSVQRRREKRAIEQKTKNAALPQIA